MSWEIWKQGTPPSFASLWVPGSVPGLDTLSPCGGDGRVLHMVAVS